MEDNTLITPRMVARELCREVSAHTHRPVEVIQDECSCIIEYMANGLVPCCWLCFDGERVRVNLPGGGGELVLSLDDFTAKYIRPAVESRYGDILLNPVHDEPELTKHLPKCWGRGALTSERMFGTVLLQERNTGRGQRSRSRSAASSACPLWALLALRF